MKNKIINSISFFLIILIISNCSINPATGERELVLLSENEEDTIGKTEHPKILESFGGVYENKRLQNYIESLGNYIVNTSELPNKKFTFSILNTPIVNAFALPGGYIYLTRGLIYLCENEAQLAGVIAHEIGHITARHTAKRYTQSFSVGLLANMLGAVNKNFLLNDLINKSASLYLLSFSRSQEYEADQLAVRYMVRAGFDPQEMGNFLKLMERYAKLQKKIMRITKRPSELLQTHPNSSKRVNEVINKSNEKIPFNPIIGTEIFLKKIDGIVFGDKPDEGFFVKNSFIHKKLDFSFNFDKNFYFTNFPNYILGISEKETKIVFDLKKSTEINDKKYLSKWTKTSLKKIKQYKEEEINGFRITSGIIQKKKITTKIATLKNPNFIYRFVLISNPEEFKKLESSFDRIVYSFRKVSNSPDLRNIEPPKIKILKNSNNTGFIESLKKEANLQTKFSNDFFDVINNLNKENYNKKERLKFID